MSNTQVKTNRRGSTKKPHPVKNTSRSPRNPSNGGSHASHVRSGYAGGLATSSNRKHMAEIGRLGGMAYHQKRGVNGKDQQKKSAGKVHE